MMKLFSFFKVKRPWDIRWAHAVNSLKELEYYCYSQQVMMIEGDICLRNGVLVMAHDRAQKVDVIFDQWIEKIASSQKGAKLDFKDPLAVLPCLKKLQSIHFKNPVFLNADVVQGPGGATPNIKVSEFIHPCKDYYPDGILSMGWTTGFLPRINYSTNMIHVMLDIIRDIDTPITFPIRSCYLQPSHSTLKPLTQKENHTITIWNGEFVSDDLKNWMKDTLDHNKFFYDLTDENGNPLEL